MQPACNRISVASRRTIFTAAALALGALLLGGIHLIALLSQGFYYGVDPVGAPILLFTGLLLAVSFLSLALLPLVPRLPPSRWLLLTLLLAGLLMRLSLFDSYPVMEIDFYRYLWDGAVLANGFDPYALSPAQVPGSELSTLALQAGAVFERINYRDLNSIYPPLAQLLFAVAYWLDPWQADALRYLYLAADCTTLALLVTALGRLGLSPCWSCLYWWNPLLIVLSYNGLHMDILLLPLLLAALLLMIERRPLAAGLALALAAGIKLWPLLLLPFALRPLLAQPRQLALAVTAVVALGSLVLLPLLVSAGADHSGLAAFSQHWQRNSILFPQLVQLLTPVSADPQWHARLLVAFTLVLLLIYLLRREPAAMPITIRHMTIVVAALFLLGPVQLPWYCLWFLPLLCFYPAPALMLLVALMPIYFLRFHFDLRGESVVFDQAIVWLQYLPPLLLLLVTPSWHRQTASSSPQHV